MNGSKRGRARSEGSGRGADGARALAATTDRYATEVALDVLGSGGNAVDAAMAASFALAVVNPEAGNVGGGGFLLARSPDGEISALDYRSTAPRRADRRLFSPGSGDGGAGGEGVPDTPSVTGHLAAAVPGAVRGLWEAHRALGRAEWASLVEPAVRLARGFRVRPRFTASFTPAVVRGLRRFPESARVFLPGPDSNPPAAGETFRQPDLAATLERIRDRGPEGFYGGETADRIVAEMRRGGGLIEHDDLERYRARWREPVRVEYRDAVVVSMPPASSGGITLAAAAGILSHFPLSELRWHGPDHIHLLCEAWKRAYADRNHYLADPDFVDMPLDVLTSTDYAAWRARGVTDDRATPAELVEPGVEIFLGRDDFHPTGGSGVEGESTTHLSVVDPEGGAVSLTTTLNTWYGSKVVVPGTGILLNNEMDDFTIAPGRPNFFGLVQGEANAIAPGKRMLSAMTPTMVLGPDGRLRLVVGSPGGATIITTVFQVVSNVVDFGMSLDRAVRAPRVHHQHLPDRIDLEPDTLSHPVVRDLEAMGHQIRRRDERWGDVQAVLVGEDGGLRGESDPRRGGTALGF